MRTCLNKTIDGPTPSFQTTIMEKSLTVTRKSRKAKYNMFWAVVNGIISSVLFYDLIYACPSYSAFTRACEGLAVLLFTFNTGFHLCSYMANKGAIQTVSVTSEQKQLLGIKDTDPNFRLSSYSNTSGTAHSTPLNLSAISWRSSSSSSGQGVSCNCTVTPSSWEYLCNVSRHASPKSSPENSFLASNMFDLSNFSSPSIGFIESEESLSQYLNDFEEYEKCLEESSNVVWKTSSGRLKMENPSLRGMTYQLSTPSPVQKLGGVGEGVNELGVGASALKSAQDVWVRLGVERAELTQWNSNLRRWLSETVLERLVREFDAVDQGLARAGLADMRVGAVGLERLKKTAQTSQVLQNSPTLPLLVRFLELSSNQEYLVARIRELAKGGCMSEFRWNGGGKLHGKDWDHHLPTDAALAMFMLATYLDTQLPPLPHNPEGQPFTSEYLVRAPASPGMTAASTTALGPDHPRIVEVQQSPPHYALQVCGQQLDVGKGRNNFLHTVLLFLQQMSEKEHCMLGRVNMGPSGLNLLWVIDR